jgi:hypothetical protein
MTEAEWLACADNPRRMLGQLTPPVSFRKLRLLLCGSCRPFGHLLSDPRILRAVEVCERFVDDRRATRGELAEAYAAADAAYRDLERLKPFESVLAMCAALATSESMTGREMEVVAATPPGSWEVSYDAWRRTQCDIIRDMFGNPFRPASADPSWLSWNDGALRKLARAIYEGYAFDRLPILADALEDAGCENADLLAHCRGPGPHVRGCWVVDLLLGKE